MTLSYTEKQIKRSEYQEKRARERKILKATVRAEKNELKPQETIDYKGILPKQQTK
jgi:hypothetical protein